MPEINESLRATIETSQAQPDRFLLVGSYGRAAILGDDITGHSQTLGKSRRFQDVDFIDTTGLLRKKYAIPGGADLDAQLTQQVRPIDSDSWGLFDKYAPDDHPPLVIVDADLLPTEEVDVDQLGAIRTFGPDGHLALTHLIDYYHPFPKHADQVERLHAISTYQGSGLEQAMTEYTAKMKEKYQKRSLYRLLQLTIAVTAPKHTLTLPSTASNLVPIIS